MDEMLELAKQLASEKASPLRAIKDRIAYVVPSNARPWRSGEAFRTHWIAHTLSEQGIDALCFGLPASLGEASFQYSSDFSNRFDKMRTGVRYFDCSLDSVQMATELEQLNSTAQRLVERFKIFRPRSVLSVSDWKIGLPAWAAAKKLGIDFFCEVRTFTDLEIGAKATGNKCDADLKLVAGREAFLAKEAKFVFTRHLLMMSELARRGVDDSSVLVVPDGVAPSSISDSNCTALRQELGIKPDEKVILCFRGAESYDDLDVVIDACTELVKKGEKLKLLLLDEIQPLIRNCQDESPDGQSVETDLISRLDIPSWLIQVSGRVPEEYWTLADVVLIPSKKRGLYDIVPPMKAVVALAYGKRLVMPNAASLAEFANRDGSVVSFEAESIKSMAQALLKSLKLPAPRLSVEPPVSIHFEVAVSVLKGERHVFEKQVTDRLLVANEGQKVTAQETALKSNPPILKSSNDRLREFSLPEPLELPQKDPIWHLVPVIAGQSLIIEAASEYHNVKGVQNRKAVLLINAFDAKGNPVDKPCGKLTKSSHLKAFFKYLPCTQNQIQELHSFTVPDGVSELRVGLCGFNKKEYERVVLRELRVKLQPEKLKPDQFVPPSPMAAEISILGWPEQQLNGKPYVIGIMDEFTTGCFEHDVNLIQPRPDNWYALAEKYKPEFFFIESAWKGNYGSWQYRVAEYANKPGQEVHHICQYARERGIPTLFWNKEDPVHHQKFMCSAKLVDHIFTTDANMKDSYQAKTGNSNVHALPFAAQPALHKPAPLAGRKPRACFAGSWYGNRHAERGEAMRWLLHAAKLHGLDIYDRNHGTGIFPFPDEYSASIKGSLPYKALCQEYSRYRVFLNVNSVTDSPTMFSRRVFELMACGTPVVSTYAKGIETLFESDAVWLVSSQQEAYDALHSLMTDDVEWRRRSLAGIREVFAKHTYAHRLNDIFNLLGIETSMVTNPIVALVAEVHSQTELNALNNFARNQSYRGFRIGIVCAHGLAAVASPLSENISLLQRGQMASWLAERRAESPLVGWLRSQHRYGEHYLRDLVNASIYEPEAVGWAKALDRDRFAYEGEARISGSIWRLTEFLKQPINANQEDLITRSDLFLADCDQFKAVSSARQLVGA